MTWSSTSNSLTNAENDARKAVQIGEENALVARDTNKLIRELLEMKKAKAKSASAAVAIERANPSSSSLGIMKKCKNA